MDPSLGAKRTIKVGEEIIIEADAPDGGRGVVFEDDGRTGYFYARDYAVPDQLFVDALHIYSLKEVVDAHIPSELHILWSDDGMKAVLILNRHPHAAFDFSIKCSYSRDQFPDPDPKTGWRHEPWADSLRAHFFSEE
jgi:hypothetical protein